MSVHLDIWLRELSRTGLSPSAQRDLLATLATAIDCRARYFPDAPRPYLARVKDLLMSAFLPQKGPLLLDADPPTTPGRISRSRAWEIAFFELSLLDGSRRPARELHIVLIDVIHMIARNEFPSFLPPRWLSELFEVLGRVAPLQLDANKWSLAPSPSLDLESQTYVKSALKNLENDKRRSRRQHFKFMAQEDEELVDDSGHPPPCAEGNAVIPAVPAGLGLYVAPSSSRWRPQT